MTVECVVNISEGRDRPLIDRIASAAERTLLDVHTDAVHHRSVLTLGGPHDDIVTASRAVVSRACALIDMGEHAGVHPRLGAADVVPFVSLDGADDEALALRDDFAGWAARELGLPCFLYGPERSLPTVRREAFRSLAPDTGPPTPHPTAGASAVGARPVLVAYNVWVVGPEHGETPALGLARRVASAIRGPALRSLGLPAGDQAQVSCNLIDPDAAGPAQAYDLIARAVTKQGGAVVRAELVGLVPSRVLADIPAHRHAQLDLSQDRTIEARLESAGSLPAPLRRR